MPVEPGLGTVFSATTALLIAFKKLVRVLAVVLSPEYLWSRREMSQIDE